MLAACARINDGSRTSAKPTASAAEVFSLCSLLGSLPCYAVPYEHEASKDGLTTCD